MSILQRIPILRIGEILLVSIQDELRDTSADRMQDDLLAMLQKTSASGVVIDISGLEIVDSYVGRVIAETSRMSQLMGARAVLVGMRPYVAATLVQMGFHLLEVETALNLEEGLAKLRLS
jgi:rsbT antagonist protein RsbS